MLQKLALSVIYKRKPPTHISTRDGGTEVCSFYFFKQKPAYEVLRSLDSTRVLFRSIVCRTVRVVI